MSENNDLRIELQETLVQLDRLIDTAKLQWEHGPEYRNRDISVYEAVSRDGLPLLQPLIVAKAQVLCALAAMGPAEPVETWTHFCLVANQKLEIPIEQAQCEYCLGTKVQLRRI